jgi:glutamate carboxypeptidase
MPAGPRRYLPRAARATIPPMRDLLDRLDGWRDEQIEFLARLVNHDSGTDDVVDVNGVGAILAERLERLGFAVRRVVNDRFGDHLVGDKPGSGPKRFLFVGHYDTVFPSGTAKQRPFRIDPQGRAWGPGVYDMKGGLAAVLYAMRAHREARTRTWEETNVTVVFNADEERLSPTSREVIEAESRRAHSVGILEPARPDGEYVMARKGAGSFYLDVTGKASHAGVQPELGASAIWDLAQKVTALHALTDFETGTTVNVGTVRGGERPNVVADRAFAEIDLRAWTRQEAEVAMAAMRRICERVHVPGTRTRFWGEIQFPPWPPGLPGTMRLLEIMAAAGRELGVEVRAIKTGGGSDGNTTSAIAPTIDGLGPRGSRAHSDEEFVEIATLLERTKMIALFLDRWAREFTLP